MEQNCCGWTSYPCNLVQYHHSLETRRAEAMDVGLDACVLFNYAYCSRRINIAGGGGDACLSTAVERFTKRDAEAEAAVLEPRSQNYGIDALSGLDERGRRCIKDPGQDRTIAAESGGRPESPPPQKTGEIHDRHIVLRPISKTEQNLCDCCRSKYS